MAETGQRRAFLKHRLYGTVIVIETDDKQILAAAVVTEAIACRHRLAEYQLSLDEAGPINSHRADYDPFDPVCSDPRHLLADIIDAERYCRSARAEWEAAAAKSKVLKELYEAGRDRVLTLVGEAAEPRPLPLFDEVA